MCLKNMIGTIESHLLYQQGNRKTSVNSNSGISQIYHSPTNAGDMEK